jgi:hypothetical protein
MSIRWIRSVSVDGRPTTLEVMLGWAKIADKCYIRVGNEDEFWFRPPSQDRQSVLAQGLSLLRRRLDGHEVTTHSGAAYAWN